MKIGLIIFSRTGNTYSVAEKLRNRLSANGHEAIIERVTYDEAAGRKETDPNKVLLTNIPDPEKYDALVFGSPVEGFSTSIAMSAYLSRLGPLNGRKVACLATQMFPYAWLGGNRTISQMSKVCSEKGANVTGGGIVNWSCKDRDKRINDTVERLSSIF
jgi:flavodoxin